MPERKVMFRQNPNIEIRNSKQIRTPNDKMTGNFSKSSAKDKKDESAGDKM
jgi:hypothetical protein